MSAPTDQAAHGSPGWQAYVPGLAVVRSYRRAWLPKDIVAGLVLSALLVPQGMAYAELAGLPAVTGLYTSILCLLGYAIFGPSRVLVLGPDSALGSMIAATILPLMMAGGDPARAVALASLLAVLVGVLMTIAGLARFGFVADLLSKPTQIGYMNGLAVTIVVGQLPKLLGFSVDADGLIAETKGFVVGMANGDANATAAAIGVSALVGILLLNRLLPKLPSVLIVVVHQCPGREPARPAVKGRGHDRCSATGIPAVHPAAGHPQRRTPAAHRSLRDRHRRACGHDVDRLVLRGQAGRAGPG